MSADRNLEVFNAIHLSMTRTNMAWFARKRRVGEEEVRVLRADASVHDAAALDRLLSQLPEGEELRSHLHNVFFARAWHKETDRDYWLSSDGALATCFTLCGLTFKQAAAVRVRWDAVNHQVKLSERALAAVVSTETRQTVQAISFVTSEPARRAKV
jgi:hypothetical protein